MIVVSATTTPRPRSRGRFEVHSYFSRVHAGQRYVPWKHDREFPEWPVMASIEAEGECCRSEDFGAEKGSQ